MNLTLRVWRQPQGTHKGQFDTYHLNEVSPDISFLEMLDVLNDTLQRQGVEPIAFDHDCREGI